MSRGLGDVYKRQMTARWFGQPIGVSFNTQDGEKEYQIGVDLNGDWQPGAISQLPEAVSKQLGGHLPWQGNVLVTLPHKGGASYLVNLDGDLKNVSSRLPAPLDKTGTSALPVKVLAKGNLNSLDLSGSVGDRHRFNSRWLLGKQLKVDRGILSLIHI